MRERLLPHHRGIIIAGTAGSGKTTLAKALTRRVADARVIEASACVIGPALMMATFPKSADAFVMKLLRAQKRRVAAHEREAAKTLNQELRRAYGPSIIGLALHAMALRDAKGGIPIITGVRGNDTMEVLRALGYITVFVDVTEKTAVQRLMRRDGVSRSEALAEVRRERQLFEVADAKNHADIHLVLPDGAVDSALATILDHIAVRECSRCINDTANPTITIGADGRCSVCSWYKKHFSETRLEKERTLFKNLRGTGVGEYDIAVGISGGKDSTAMLATVLELGFTPLAFTLDTGYYPAHSFARAKAVAKKLGVDWVRADIRGYARACDKASFRMTANLYDLPETPDVASLFRGIYAHNREHYAITCKHPMPFVRSCILCRRLVIRAYHALATEHGIKTVALGMNEWTGLSSIGTKAGISAMRELRPSKKGPSVTIVHVPFLFRRKRKDTAKILKKLGWKAPMKESFVESNANSCLLAFAMEAKAARLLGFHPDTTRLAREVTAGFLTKTEARHALATTHPSPHSARAILRKAGLL